MGEVAIGTNVMGQNAYHREVFEKLAPRLTEDERDWLAKKCAAIGA